jgi:hypothetical protein
MTTSRYNPNPNHGLDPEVAVLTPATYKAYAEAYEPEGRFRFEGLTSAQRLEFVGLINDREISLGRSQRHYLPPYVFYPTSA